MTALYHTGYDSILEKCRGSAPLAFMRALAYGESHLNPEDEAPDGGAVGLFQIRKIALTDYNRAHKTTWRLADMKDAERNATVAGWLLNEIVHRWQSAGIMSPDWQSLNYAALLVYAYNAGWSESRGVGAVIKALKQNGVKESDLTPALVRQGSIVVPGASPHIMEQARADYAMKVARVYLNVRPRVAAKVERKTGPGAGFAFAALGALAAGIVLATKGRARA